MKVTNELRIERARHNLTQETLAEKSGCVRQTISQIERYEIIPSILLVLRIVKFLNTLKIESKQIIVDDLFKLEEL